MTAAEQAAEVNRTGNIREKRQLLTLYRTFLFRVIDLELLSASGDIRNLLAQFTALLAAYSFVLALFTVTHFALATADPSRLVASAWGLEEFLISTTITVVGLFAVLAWNALLPDRRDALILDPLPLRIRTIWCAKSASTITALAVSVIAVNLFTGLTLPFLIVPGGGLAGVLRCFTAYWLTLGAAGAFAFGSIFAVQSTAASLLSFQVFQRVSSFLQLATLFSFLALFFLTPPLATPSRLSSSGNSHLLAVLPSFWFLGLFHELNGTSFPAFQPLARRGAWSVAAVCLFGLSVATLTYGRNLRRAVQQPDIAPGALMGRVSSAVSAVTARVLRDPIDRAVVLFSARTLARSRQHRLVFAVYIGIALAISLAYAKSLVYGTAEEYWRRPGVPLLITGLVTLFFGILGGRAVFALPFALQANWVFRITAVRKPAAYFSAVRKTLFAVAALPVLLFSSGAYLAIWPFIPAVQHVIVLVLLAVWLVEVLLRKFHKIPFTCSYLPGKSNLRLKLGIAGALFLLAMDLGATIEYWSMDKMARYLKLVAILTAIALWAARRTTAFAGAPHNRIQFEDVPTADIFALDLRRDSGCENDSDYLDAVSSGYGRF